MKKKLYTIALLALMTAAVNGQVGIGTATPDTSSILDLTTTTKGLLAPRLTTANRDAITLPAYGLTIFNTSNNRIEINIGTTTVPNWQPAGGLSSVSTEPWFNQATGTEANGNTQNIYQLGNVGIGNNAPKTRLEVDGVGAVSLPATTGTTPATGTVARFKGSNNALIDFGSNSTGGQWIQATDAGALGTNYPLLLNPNGGNTGIGLTTAPAQRLDVNGAALLRGGGAATATDGTQLLFGYSTQSNFQHAIKTRHDANTTATTGNAIDFYVWTPTDAAGAQPTKRVMTINGVGNVGIGTATPATMLEVAGVITATKIQGPSDQRFKKNIKPIENALQKVMKLGGYTYDWKDASEFPNQTLGKGHDMRVIAQEVEKQFPEAVSTNADGYKAVSYTELVPALIEAIKAQQAQIDELKAQVAKLKK